MGSTSNVNKVYRKTKAYEAFIGGEPIEDVAVYFSDVSKMNFADNGTPLKDMDCGAKPDYPHFEAVKGACKKLAAAHLPFGVITRQNLDDISNYKVIVLPNILRMNKDEVRAFRRYVETGGRLYASRLTSLTATNGKRSKDFALSGVFGCHFVSEERGRICYTRPTDRLVQQALAPERSLGHRNATDAITGSVRLKLGSGTSLATLSLPFGYPNEGTTKDQNWASIHSDPPWEHTDKPTIVSNHYGNGKTVFSACDIEAGDSDGCQNIFIALIKNLMGAAPSFEADAHPAVWMNASDQADNNRIILSFLNYQTETPVIPIFGIPFQITPPHGKRFTRLLSLPEMEDVKFTVTHDGRIQAKITKLETFSMFAAEYTA